MARIPPSDVGQLGVLQCRAREEMWPDSAPQPVERAIRRLKSMTRPDATVWLALDMDQKPLGRAVLTVSADETSAASLLLFVIPERRRSGMAKALLKQVAMHCRAKGIERIQTITASHIQASDCLLKHLSGVRLHAIRVIDVVPQVNGGPPSSGPYRPFASSVAIQLVDASTLSAELVNDIAPLRREVAVRYSTAFAASSDNLAVEEWIHHSALISRSGYEWLILAATTHAGRCVGFSGYYWDQEDPELLVHSDLAVAEPYRFTGLAPELIRARRLILAAKSSITRVRYRRLFRVSQLADPPAPIHLTGERVVSTTTETRWRVWTDAILEAV